MVCMVCMSHDYVQIGGGLEVTRSVVVVVVVVVVIVVVVTCLVISNTTPIFGQHTHTHEENNVVCIVV